MSSKPVSTEGEIEGKKFEKGTGLRGFEWLDDSLVYNDCYVSHDYSLAAKTVDFGYDGFTASMADWHFLLQMTAPDAKCGIVYARGNFPDNADAILARTQNEEGQGSWGFKVSKDSQIKIGEFGFQGLINYRWPCFSNRITAKSGKSGEQDEIGQLYICTFIKDQTLSQVVVVRKYDEKSEGKLTFRFGGPVRFGCFCSNKTYNELSQNRVVEAIDSEGGHSRYNMRYSHNNLVRSAICEAGRYKDVGLDMQLFINGEARQFVDQKKESQLSYIDMSTEQTVVVDSNGPTVIIGTISLVTHRDLDRYLSAPPLSEDIEQYLGVSTHSEASTGKLWADSEELGPVIRDHSETHAIARSVERIMGVSLVPSVHVQLPVADQPRGGLPNPTPAHQIDKAEPGRRSSSIPRSALSEHSNHQDKSRPASASGLRDGTSEKQGVDTTVELGKSKTIEGSAVIENIISKQYVTWESTFWQARLLVKAHNYLETRRPPNTFATTSEHTVSEVSDLKLSPNEIHALYLAKIKYHVQEILSWILSIEEDVQHELFPTGKARSARESCEVEFSDDDIDTNSFRIITAWYIIKFFKAELDATIFDAIVKYLDRLRTQLAPPLHAEIAAIPSSLTTQEKLQYALLKWVHFGSLHEICKRLVAEEHPHYSEESPFTIQVDKSKNEWRIESDKALKALRKRPPDQRPPVDPAQVYLRSDEELDRFVMLCAELGFDTWDSTDTAKKIVMQTRAKTRERKASTKLNPGIKFEQSSKTDDFSAPWELNCLNHHIYLCAFATSADDTDLRLAKENCLSFMLSNFDIAPSWDMSNADTTGNWWDVETTSVVCATLLDLKELEKTRAEGPKTGNALKLQTRQTIDWSLEPSSEDGKPLTLKDIQQVLRIDVPDAKEIIPFDWKALQPRGYAAHYHPEFVLHSLDDTPEDFTEDRRKKIKLRSDLETYFRRRRPTGAGDWSIEAIHKILDVEDVLYTNVIDFCSDDRLEDAPSWRYLTYKEISRRFYDGNYKGLPQDVVACFDRIAKTSGEAGARRLWSFYVNGNASQSPEWVTLTEVDRKILQSSQTVQEKYKERLLNRLSDSFVDLGTRYRILFAQRLSPAWLQAFIYIWHQDALDALNNYIATDTLRSTFEDTPGNVDSPWITSITISHWAFKLRGLPDRLAKRFDEGRGSGQMPPKEHQKSSQSLKSIGRLRSKEKVQKKNAAKLEAIRDIEERSSSIVITGDSLGNYWNCSVISSLVREDNIEDFDYHDYHDMWNYHQQAIGILRLFVHQPAVARRLVFLALVGHLCVDLAREYNAIVVHLENTLESSRHIIFDGFKLDNSTRALTRLPRLFWGLETFRAFDNTLSLSVVEIEAVKKRLIHETRELRKQWSPTLQEGYEDIMEEFDKRYESLYRVLDNIKQKVEQITRLRDGISSITQVQQSFESLEQNSNIRILTFITIGYLPLGFIAALFSIGNYPILPSDSGKALFIGLILIFMAATIVFAYLMKPVSEILDRMYDDWRDWWHAHTESKSGDPDRQEPQRQNSTQNTITYQNEIEKTKEEGDKANGMTKKSTGFKIDIKNLLRRHKSETGRAAGDVEAGGHETDGARLEGRVLGKNGASKSNGTEKSSGEHGSVVEFGKEK